MNLLPIFNVAQAMATALGVALAFRRREYRPVAAFLAIATAADYVRSGLRTAFDLGTPGPYSGLRRAAFHIDGALFLLWPFGVAALAFVVLAGRSVRSVVAAYALLVLALVATYPLSRAEVLHTIYMIVFGATVVIGVATIGSWLRRKESAKEVEHFSTFILLALTHLFATIPFVLGAFVKWEVSFIGSIASYLLLSIVAVRSLVSRQSPPVTQRRSPAPWLH